VFGSYVNYLLAPIAEHRTWVWGAYEQPGRSRLAGTLLGTLSSRIDWMVFRFQDRPALLSQSDPAGDFSRFHLYGADRGIALFFGMRKRALLAAHGAAEQSMSAAAGR